MEEVAENTVERNNVATQPQPKKPDDTRKKYYEKNAEKIRERERERYTKNRELILQKSKERRDKNTAEKRPRGRPRKNNNTVQPSLTAQSSLTAPQIEAAGDVHAPRADIDN